MELNIRHTICILLTSVVLLACQKEGYFGPVTEKSPAIEVDSSTQRILIGCEGNFQYGNASLSVFYPDQSQTENGVFEKINGFTPGDVLQSLSLLGDSIFMVMNNSGLIRILNHKTLEQIDIIDGLNSPRYIAFLDNQTALISDYGSGELTHYDLDKMQILGKIDIGSSWTERIVLTSTSVYVMGKSDSSIFKLNRQLLSAPSRIKLSFDPIYLAVHEDEVFAVGNASSGSEIVKLVDDAPSEIKTFSNKVSVATHDSSGLLLVFKDHLVKTDFTGAQINQAEHDVQTPYGAYMDEQSVLIADVKDYLSAGEIAHFSIELSPVGTYKLGLIPQCFLSVKQ